MKNLLAVTTLILSMLFLGGCRDDADIARQNSAKAADNFEIMRRIIYYNSITDSVIMITEGKCSVSPTSVRTEVTCKINQNEFITNFYGKSDNTSYYVEQMESIPLNVYHYRRTFKPQSIIPDIDLRFESEALIEAITPDSND